MALLNAGETATRVMLEASGRRPSMAYKVPALKKLVALGIKRLPIWVTNLDFGFLIGMLFDVR
jgi:hypothetical protein